MRALLLTNALTALAEKDGRTTRETVTVIVESVLDSLKSPSPDVLFAGAAGIHRVTAVVVSYEQARVVLTRFIEAAERN